MFDATLKYKLQRQPRLVEGVNPSGGSVVPNTFEDQAEVEMSWTGHWQYITGQKILDNWG